MIALAQLVAVKWLLASAGALAAGLLVWMLLRGASRLWPALRTQRSVWLAAQATVAMIALLPFLPRATQLSLAPPITLPAPAPATTATPPAAVVASAGPASSLATVAPASSATPAASAGTVASAGLVASAEPLGPIASASPTSPGTASAHDSLKPQATAAQAPAAAPSPSAIDALPLLAAVWLAVYSAGLARAVAKRLQARRLWRALLATAEPLSPAALQAHGAFSPAQLHELATGGPTVARTDAAISPLLTGIHRPLLLLPAHLDALSREQQQMIIAHELHHWRARDPLYLAIAATLQTLFWFIPALRWMAQQMEWALELQCDQHVLQGRPQQQRKQYAAALLQQWTTQMPTAAAAFGGATVTARIRQMQRDELPSLSATAALLTASALAVIVVGAAILQPALAYNIPPTIAPAPTAAPATPQPWRAPLDKVRVTSFYGVMSNVLPTPHKGIDFTAARGTPVHAVADGTVLAAGQIAENNGRYGKVVIIDHGGQQSLYAHLDRVKVQPGQRVQAGQLIGAAGSSGYATGPHLHLEARQTGHNIDPAPLFNNLDTYATAHARRVRRQQLSAEG